MTDIKAAFDEHDEDGNGKIDLIEFRAIALKLGLDLGRSEAEALFDEVDADETGFIDYEEFAKWYAARSTDG
jgi:Ca2+-binding EF-hand superfamily protein